ncbi:MRGRH protein, partial [Brachypteracias leptosomus]|nr:MRGRH protein [Brachypteracias leptosomus]
MSTFFPTTERATWSQPDGVTQNRSWHHRLLRHEGDNYNWADCEPDHLSQVPATLIICSCGLLGNGAILWFLSSRARRSPVTLYVLNLAIADFTFLLSIALALGIFCGPKSLCHRLGSRDVTTVLNVITLFSFTASIYLLTALSATTSLSILPPPPCQLSQHLPVLLCALLWALSFLFTMTLHFCPSALIVFVLSYLLVVLTLIFSGLTLLARLLCCSRPFPPRQLCLVVLLVVFFFPFFTADFGFWLFLRLFDFPVFVFDVSLLLASVKSSINPLIYFLVGSCASKFTLSVRTALERVFEEVAEPQNRDKTPGENTGET